MFEATADDEPTTVAGGGAHDAPAGHIELSVVIPVFNAATTIEDQLQALVAQQWSGSWEVVVADNGSTDSTAEVVGRVARTNSRVRMVDASDVSGPSSARNAGVAAARGMSVAFCDADDVVSDGWLRAMGESLRKHSFVTGPQGFERLNPPWLWGVYGTRSARELQTFEGIFPFGPSANLGVRRSEFDAVGGFDPTIHVGEDLDLCLRLWRGGVELVFVEDALLHYRYRPSLRALWRQALSYGASAPMIARKLADGGGPTPAKWAGAKRWLWLVRKLPSLRTQAGRARWIVVAGGSSGRLIGSVRQRRVLL